MVWQNDHFIEVSFSQNRYADNQLKLYNEKEIRFLGKLIQTAKLRFINLTAQ